MAGGRPTHFEGDLRLRLLEGAETAIAQEGLAALSLRAVAKRIGVSHAAPAHHFRDKRALVTALAIHGANALAAALTASLDETDAAPDRLAALGRAYIRFARTRPALFEVMLQRNASEPADEELVRAERAAYDVLRTAVRDAVDGGWAAGSDTEAVSLTLWSAVHGAAALVLDGELDGAASDVVVDTLIALGAQRAGA